MKFKRNQQEENEWRIAYAWLPVWTEDEVIWLEEYEHSWSTTSTGDVVTYYRSRRMLK